MIIIQEPINDSLKHKSIFYFTAIDLINNLLQVKQRKRFTVDKSLSHTWLQEIQTWNDLRALEAQIGLRYITHESDDARYLNAHVQWPQTPVLEEESSQSQSPKTNDMSGKAFKWMRGRLCRNIKA